MENKGNWNPSDWINEHAEVLYDYARSRMINDAELQSVMINTITTAFENSEKTRNSSELHETTWLIAILRREIISYYKAKYSPDTMKESARKTIRTILSRPFVHSVDTSRIDAKLLDEFDRKTFWKAASECLSMLVPVQAEIYILRELEDVSCEEISSIFGLNRQDTLETIFRARMMFVQCLLNYQEATE